MEKQVLDQAPRNNSQNNMVESTIRGTSSYLEPLESKEPDQKVSDTVAASITATTWQHLAIRRPGDLALEHEP